MFAHSPDGGTAAALAEDKQMTQEERIELWGDLPDRADQYCARAFELIRGAVAILGLPPEVRDSITGDFVALYGAGLLIADMHAADRPVDDDASEA